MTEERAERQGKKKKWMEKNLSLLTKDRVIASVIQEDCRNASSEEQIR